VQCLGEPKPRIVGDAAQVARGEGGSDAERPQRGAEVARPAGLEPRYRELGALRTGGVELGERRVESAGDLVVAPFVGKQR
jgi:hypothetical protein